VKTDSPHTSARRRPTLTWHQKQRSTLTAGERAADTMRNVMGSWRFVAGFLLFMVVWAVLNSVSGRWDPYPFILLNLFLSMLAGLQGAILLIAAKRQDGISAALAQHDFDTNAAAKIDIEALLEINNRQLVMLDELQALVRSSAAVDARPGSTIRYRPRDSDEVTEGPRKASWSKWLK
jgi:uncharacterized membrane protein